jgi:excinuclease UvrABC helicase subunit UvrB
MGDKNIKQVIDEIKKNKVEEKKYFISYAAYYQPEGKYDIFNDLIYINNKITRDVLDEIQKMMIEKLNKNTKNNPYYVAQVISVFEI